MNKEVIEYFNSLPEVIRLKELEPYIEGSTRVQETFSRLKEIQKQMVNSKEYNQSKQFLELQEEYIKVQDELKDIPFVEEYLELVDIVNTKLQEFSMGVEKYLDKKINE